MKYISNVIIIITLFLSGCGKSNSISGNVLNEVEGLVSTQPDSAYKLLATINPIDSLDDGDFAKWCMLYCTLSKKIPIPSLSTEQLEQAVAWYDKYGTMEEQLQIDLFLGESYLKAGDTKKAMTIYTEISHEAKRNRLYNILGYAYSYIAELYELQNYMSESVEYFKRAADNFKQAKNIRSYACALRDLGREYVFMDSIPLALNLIKKADSIVQTISDDEVRGSTLNALGNIALIKEDYREAESYFLKALSIAKDSVPNYFALVDLYVQEDSLQKAKMLLQKMPHNDSQYLYSIRKAYYNIYKKEGNYLEALQSLEECVYVNDSLIIADNEAKVLELEKKYNNLKIQKESADLKLSQQKYRVITILCIAVILLILLISFWYKRKAENKIYNQQTELREMKSRILQLSLESEKKKEQLNLSISEIEKLKHMREEREVLIAKYQKLRMSLLVNSTIYKKLKQLIDQNIPRNDKSLITEEYWRLITEQIVAIYPDLKYFLLEQCPQLSEQEWRYCCLYLFCFDSNEEAKLLNITPGSARTKRLRLRRKLNISLSDEVSLYEYIFRNVY